MALVPCKDGTHRRRRGGGGALKLRTPTVRIGPSRPATRELLMQMTHTLERMPVVYQELVLSGIWMTGGACASLAASTHRVLRSPF